MGGTKGNWKIGREKSKGQLNERKGRERGKKKMNKESEEK